MSQFSSRIHILLASNTPLGLVIRRGPSKHVATILWDRSNDEFQLWQWLKGRIYERHCDLSSDGKYFIYFAMNGKWDSEAEGAWTAISRAPYLKALAIFPKGDCWHGGGLWTNQNRYWLNDGHGHSVLRDTEEIRRDKWFKPSRDFGGECPGVYYLRLVRDGWRYLEHHNHAKWKETDVFEKSIPSGWLLRIIAHAEVGSPRGKGCYWDEHQLVHKESDTQINYPDWEWAELDGECLVWAKDGKLFRGRMESNGLTDESEIIDFNPMAFEPIEAPY